MQSGTPVGFEEILIDEVRQQDALWHSSSHSFADKQAAREIWNKIAANLASKNIKASPDECKKKWKYLRDNYVKHKKKWPPWVKRTWKFFNHLSFLGDIGIPPGDYRCQTTLSPTSTDNQSLEQDDQDEPQSFVQDDPPPVKKRRIENDSLKFDQRKEIVECMRVWREKQQSSKDSDGLDSFGHHVASTIRSLRPELAVEAKFEIQQVLYRYELSNLEQPATPPSDGGNLRNDNQPSHGMKSEPADQH